MASNPQQFNLKSPEILGRSKDLVEVESAARDWLLATEAQKWPAALQAFENYAYLLGNPYIRFYFGLDTGFGFKLTPGTASDNPWNQTVAKSADNRLIRPVETVVNLLTQTDPEPRVTPNTDNPLDEDAARRAENFIRAMWDDPLSMGALTTEVAFGACIWGTSALEIEYGPTDVPVEVPAESYGSRPNPLWTPGSSEPKEIRVRVPSNRTKVAFREDFIARHWSFFNLIPDPGATSERDLSWIGRSSYVDKDWVAENFAKRDKRYLYSDPDELRDCCGLSNPGQLPLYWFYKLRDILVTPQPYQYGGGLSPTSYLTDQGFAPNQTLFTVIDVAPTKQFPRGRTLILAGSKLVYAGDARAWSAQYPGRWHPYAFFGWSKLPARFWHVPLLSELVPLQKKINAIDALVHANRQFMSIGQWLIPKDSKVALGQITGVSGQQILYRSIPGQAPPEKIKNVPLPGELIAERSQLLQSIDYIAASGLMSEAGPSPSATRAGVMLDAIQREKMASKGPMLRAFQGFLETVAQNLLIEAQLALANDNPDVTARLRRYLATASAESIQAFTGADLRNHTSVTIDVASATLHTPEVLAQRALEFVQAMQGNITPEERQAALKAMGLGKFVKNVQNATVTRVRRMLAFIEAGSTDAAYPMPGIDDPAAAQEVVQRYLLSEKFVELPQPLKQIVLQLFDSYGQLVQEQQQQQLQMAQAMAQAQGANAKAKPQSNQGGPQQ